MEITSDRKHHPNTLTYTIFSTPLGKTGVAVTPIGICRVVLSIGKESEFIKTLKMIHPSPKKKPDLLIAFEKEFHLYFSKRLKRFSFNLDIGNGSQFQQRVWKKLLSIPYGKTRSYKWLATNINRPKASRAVGNANGKNPIPVIIPCHRVIRKNGNLGGYTGGDQIKQYLLDLEK